MVRKVISKAKWRCGRNHPKMKLSEVKWSGMTGRSWWNVSASVHDIMYFITVIACSVSFIVRSVLCPVFCLSMVCYFV
jgi:hypothetical protein